MTHLKEGRTTLFDRHIYCACVVVVLFHYRAAAKGVVFRIHATFCMATYILKYVYGELINFAASYSRFIAMLFYGLAGIKI